MSFWQYFPLNLKNLWIYRTSEKFSDENLLTRVVINEKIPFSDKVIYIFSYYIDDEEIKKESYVLQRDGIFLYARKVENNLVVFEPLVPFLPYNFMDIDWWSWEGKVGFLQTKIVFKNQKIVEENTYKIVYTEENKFGKSEYTVFIKKNVGIVKEEAETPFVGYVSELEDYNVSFDDFSFIDFKYDEPEYQQEEEYFVDEIEEFIDEEVYENNYSDDSYSDEDYVDENDDLSTNLLEDDQILEENEEGENYDENRW